MRILIVEDEIPLADSICRYLANEQFQCEQAHDFKTARAKLEGFDYDCVILDIGLPGGSGLDLLAGLKADRKADGVLIVSAKNSLDDKVTGLRMGADDYLTKPFHLSELGARVDAIIRRKQFEGANTLTYDALTVDLQQKTIAVESSILDLTRKEYDLLLYLLRNRAKVISKAALADHLWGDDADANDNIDLIYTHVKNLRRKMQQAGSPDYIQSVYGMGYKLRIP